MSWKTRNKWCWWGDALLCPLDSKRLIVFYAGGANSAVVGPMADKLWANEAEGVWWVGAAHKLRRKSTKSKRFMSYKNKTEKTLNGTTEIPVMADAASTDLPSWEETLESPPSENNIELWRPIGAIEPGEVGVIRKP